MIDDNKPQTARPPDAGCSRAAAIVQRCDVQPGDREFVLEFVRQLEMLTGMVEEAFGTNPVYLLSPVLREMMREKGQRVTRLFDQIKFRLVVDNPGEPLVL